MRQLFAALLLMSLGEPSAFASICPIGVELRYPADGQAEVPVTSRIWMGANDGRLTFSGPEHDSSETGPFQVDEYGRGAIKGRISTIDIGERSPSWRFVQIFTPDEPLHPNTRYQVRRKGRDLWTFTTRSDVSSVPPPALPRITQISATAVDDQIVHPPPNLRATMTLDHVDGLLFVSTESDINAFDSKTNSGRISTLFQENTIELGTRLCLGTWPGTALGATISFRYGLLDFSGRFTGWSEPVQVTFPSTFRTWEDEHWFEVLVERWKRRLFNPVTVLGASAFVFIMSIGGVLVCFVVLMRRARRRTSEKQSS